MQKLPSNQMQQKERKWPTKQTPHGLRTCSCPVHCFSYFGWVEFVGQISINTSVRTSVHISWRKDNLWKSNRSPAPRIRVRRLQHNTTQQLSDNFVNRRALVSITSFFWREPPVAHRRSSLSQICVFNRSCSDRITTPTSVYSYWWLTN